MIRYSITYFARRDCVVIVCSRVFLAMKVSSTSEIPVRTPFSTSQTTPLLLTTLETFPEMSNQVYYLLKSFYPTSSLRLSLSES